MTRYELVITADAEVITAAEACRVESCPGRHHGCGFCRDHCPRLDHTDKD